MKLLAVLASAAFAGDATFVRNDGGMNNAVQDDFYDDTGVITDFGNDALGDPTCYKCDNEASVSACIDDANKQSCTGNESVCWFRITYEEDGTTEKTVNAHCKSAQVNISLINID